MQAQSLTLDLEEAANLLKISNTKMQQLASQGAVPGAKIGKSWVFVTDQLLSWLSEQAEQQSIARAMPATRPARSRKNSIPELPQFPCEV